MNPLFKHPQNRLLERHRESENNTLNFQPLGAADLETPSLIYKLIEENIKIQSYNHNIVLLISNINDDYTLMYLAEKKHFIPIVKRYAVSILFKACENGNIKIANIIKKLGLLDSISEKDLFIALRLCLLHNKESLAEIILTSRGEIPFLDHNQIASLEFSCGIYKMACSYQAINFLKLFEKYKKTNTNVQKLFLKQLHLKHTSPLIEAFSKLTERPEMANFILDKYPAIDLNFQETSYFLKTPGETLFTQLLSAINYKKPDDLRIIKNFIDTLIAKGANPNIQGGKNKKNALVAGLNISYDILIYLLNYKAEKNLTYLSPTLPKHLQYVDILGFYISSQQFNLPSFIQLSTLLQNQKIITDANNLTTEPLSIFIYTILKNTYHSSPSSYCHEKSSKLAIETINKLAPGYLEKNKNYSQPLILAASFKHPLSIVIIQALFDMGFTQFDQPPLINQSFENLRLLTPLTTASAAGNMDSFKLILKLSKNPKLISPDPLPNALWSSAYGIEDQANPKSKDELKQTQEHQLEMFTYIFNKQPDLLDTTCSTPNKHDGKTTDICPLTAAISQNNNAVAAKIIDIKILNIDKKSAFMILGNILDKCFTLNNICILKKCLETQEKILSFCSFSERAYALESLINSFKRNIKPSENTYHCDMISNLLASIYKLEKNHKIISDKLDYINIISILIKTKTNIALKYTSKVIAILIKELNKEQLLYLQNNYFQKRTPISRMLNYNIEILKELTEKEQVGELANISISSRNQPISLTYQMSGFWISLSVKMFNSYLKNAENEDRDKYFYKILSHPCLYANIYANRYTIDCQTTYALIKIIHKFSHHNKRTPASSIQYFPLLAAGAPYKLLEERKITSLEEDKINAKRIEELTINYNKQQKKWDILDRLYRSSYKDNLLNIDPNNQENILSFLDVYSMFQLKTTQRATTNSTTITKGK